MATHSNSVLLRLLSPLKHSSRNHHQRSAMSPRLPSRLPLLYRTNLRSFPTHSRTLYRAVGVGGRVEGEMNMNKHHKPSDLPSTTPSPSASAFDSDTKPDNLVDPKSNPDDCAPYEELSGDSNRSGMRSTEYSCVDKKEEPYSQKGGEHRYGGTRRYKWTVERMEKE